LTLFQAVVARLHERGAPFALIGAAAMAVHGVSRATRDLDILVLDPACLTSSYWDADDPLRGVVRLRTEGEPPVDVVVGKGAWQARIATRALEVEIEGVRVPVASRIDLILLKLYAGGNQDAWDIAQLLEGPEHAEMVADVERGLAALGPDAHALWRRIRASA
jgi:predicted nucleotidyltransferase